MIAFAVVRCPLMMSRAVWGKLDLSQTVAPSPQRWSRSSLFPVDASAVEARATLSCWLI